MLTQTPCGTEGSPDRLLAGRYELDHGTCLISHCPYGPDRRPRRSRCRCGPLEGQEWAHLLTRTPCGTEGPPHWLLAGWCGPDHGAGLISHCHMAQTVT